MESHQGFATRSRRRSQLRGPRQRSGFELAGPVGYRDWRSDVIGASGLNVLAGIWLIISPFVLNFHGGDAYWNPIVFGAIIAGLALIRAAGAFRASGLSWINAAIGIWLFISGFWLASSAAGTWDLWILGAVIFFLALISASATEEAVAQRLSGPPQQP